MKTGPPNTMARPRTVNTNDARAADHWLSSSSFVVRKAITRRYMRPNEVYATVTGSHPGMRRKTSKPPKPERVDSPS